MTRPAALITGAARGIGAATARQMAAAGWAVALVDICADEPTLGYRLATPEDLEASAEACAAAAGRDAVLTITADVRDQDGLDEAVARTRAAFGELEAAVAAAGAIAGGPETWHTDESVWSAMIDINLTGVWQLARAAVPSLLAAPEPRRGRFVAVASAAGLDGFPGLSAYAASKHGVIGLVRSMAVELGPAGVTVNAVCPGSTDTAMLSASTAVYGLASVEEFVQHQPIGRLLEPDEVAAAVVWVCSPAASGLTGAVIPVDGGMTAT